MKHTIYRGKTITHDEVIEAMKQFDKEGRNTFAPGHWRRYAVEHNGNLYPPKELLRLVTGLPVDGGGREVNAKFEGLGFKVPELESDSPPTVERAVEDAIETAFSLEVDLEKSLVGNLDQLEKGLKLYRADGFVGQQLVAKPAGIIDLLATDSNGDLVVIELKAGEADRQVCGQIQAYMGWVKSNLASGKKVRGVIVASEFTDKLKLAVTVVPDLALKKYQISFKFSEVSGLSKA